MDNTAFNASRPVAPRANHEQPQPVHHQPAHKPKQNNEGSKKSWLKPAIVLLVLAIIVFVAVFGAENMYLNNTKKMTGTSTVNSNQYQAVFLTNGQVYFGKIQSVNQFYITLSNIYYLQVQQSVQPATSNATPSTLNGSASTSSGNNNNSAVQLVKLGNELHGPEDTMTIMRPQILFWENMKYNSKVTQAINSYQIK